MAEGAAGSGVCFLVEVALESMQGRQGRVKGVTGQRDEWLQRLSVGHAAEASTVKSRRRGLELTGAHVRCLPLHFQGLRQGREG